MAALNVDPNSEAQTDLNIGGGVVVGTGVAFAGGLAVAFGFLAANAATAGVVGALAVAGFVVGYFTLGPTFGAPLDQGTSPVDTGTQSNPDIYSSGDFGIGGGDN